MPAETSLLSNLSFPIPSQPFCTWCNLLLTVVVPSPRSQHSPPSPLKFFHTPPSPPPSFSPPSPWKKYMYFYQIWYMCFIKNWVNRNMWNWITSKLLGILHFFYLYTITNSYLCCLIEKFHKCNVTYNRQMKK